MMSAIWHCPEDGAHVKRVEPSSERRCPLCRGPLQPGFAPGNLVLVTLTRQDEHDRYAALMRETPRR